MTYRYCQTCGTELTTGGCPKWDCPTKAPRLTSIPGQITDAPTYPTSLKSLDEAGWPRRLLSPAEVLETFGTTRTRERIAMLDEVLQIVKTECRGFDSDGDRIRDAVTKLREATMRKALVRTP